MAMTVRAPKDWTAEVATSAALDGMSGGRVAYGTLSSTVGSITTTEVDLISWSQTNPSGRIFLAACTVDFQSTVAGDLAYFTLYEGSTNVGRARAYISATGGNGRVTSPLIISYAATAGSQTMTVRAVRENGTGTISCVAGSFNIIDMGA